MFSYRSASGLFQAALLLLVPAVSACRDLPPPTVPDIREADLRTYVEKLSSPAYGGRAAGTLTGLAAVRFVVAEQQRNGLVPAFGASFMQEFPFRAGSVVVTSGKNNLVLRGKDGIPRTIPILPLPLSSPGSFQGPLVFAGYCIDLEGKRNDFAGLPIKKAVVACLRFGPGGKENPEFKSAMSFVSKYEAAKKHGAAAVVFMGRRTFDAPKPGDFPVRKRKGPAAAYVAPGLLEQTFPELQAAQEAAAGGRPLPTATLGPLPGAAQIETDFRQERLVGHNVGAFLRKPSPTDRIIILGAHLDHIGIGDFGSIRGSGKIHPGADDNASGTALLLELAAALRLRSAEIPAGTNVLFLHFDAEERGLFGSRAFVRSGSFDPKRTVAMINFDMVGRLRPESGLSIQGHDTADARFEKVLRTALEQAKLSKLAKLRRGGRGPSDHTSFYEKNVPVLFVTTGIHQQYHTSEDVPRLVNYEGLLSILRLAEGLVLGLSRLEGQLAFHASGAKGGMRLSRPTLRLGIVPGSYGAEDGLEVGSVQADAPVAKAGLQAGDKVVSLGGKPIADIYDLMDFLRTARPDTEYAIEYVRGKERRSGRTRLLGP